MTAEGVFRLPVTGVCRLCTKTSPADGHDSTRSSQPETESQTEHDYSDHFEEEDHQIRDKILKASLPFVSVHGWTKKSLSAGAEVEGYPSIAHGMFPRGGAELIEYFYQTSNEKLAKKLKAEVEELNSKGVSKPKTRPFIRSALEERLRMIIPYLDQWPQAMAIQALPQNALHSWKNLAQLSDDIWHYSGDESVDFNWYTKRVSLAVVYKTTEVFMTQDRSVDCAETWSFLDRRLDNLTELGSAAKNFSQCGDVVKEGLTGMYIMGRNVLGWNSRSR